jgi:hypothetical protein
MVAASKMVAFFWLWIIISVRGSGRNLILLNGLKRFKQGGIRLSAVLSCRRQGFFPSRHPRSIAADLIEVLAKKGIVR